MNAILKIRAATCADVDAIAALHVASWRSTYRGILLDEFLDGPVEENRLNLWRSRLENPGAAQIVLLTEGADGLDGFVCLLLDHGPHRHSYIDNLHVAARCRGRGLGKRLMQAAASAIPATHAAQPVSLTVFEQNRAACAFYERIGGKAGEVVYEVEPDGRELPSLKYAWASRDALLAGVGA